jgi:hypothetical protein
MFPFLPFVLGAVAGAAVVKLLKNADAKKGLDTAQDRLRSVTIQSLASIEKSSAQLREKLGDAPKPETPPEADQ